MLKTVQVNNLDNILYTLTGIFSLGILYHYLIRDINKYKRKTGYNKLKTYVTKVEEQLK